MSLFQNTQQQDINSSENICRLYEIGKVKTEEDDQVSVVSLCQVLFLWKLFSLFFVSIVSV